MLGLDLSLPGLAVRGGGVGTGRDDLLAEDGGHLLLEAGDAILLDA